MRKTALPVELRIKDADIKLLQGHPRASPRMTPKVSAKAAERELLGPSLRELALPNLSLSTTGMLSKDYPIYYYLPEESVSGGQ